jgi:hypothetical protein
MCKLFSLSATKVVTMYHPEAHLNPKYRKNTFKWVCQLLDASLTQVLKAVSGDGTLQCKAGFNLFNKVKGSLEFELMQDACRQALLRAQQQNREAITLHKAGKFEEMTKGQRNYISESLCAHQITHEAFAWHKAEQLENND